MKVKFYISFIILLGVLAIACNDNNNNTPVTPTTTSFTATLNGASETPPDSSKATGTANFTFNPVTKILTGTVNFTGINATAAHIHRGAVGVAGPVIFPLSSDSTLTSPLHFTSVALTQNQINDLMAGLYYVNIHSAAYPDGEIRGQLVKGTGTGTTGTGTGTGGY
jgi:hypothetical protein